MTEWNIEGLKRLASLLFSMSSQLVLPACMSDICTKYCMSLFQCNISNIYPILAPPSSASLVDVVHGGQRQQCRKANRHPSEYLGTDHGLAPWWSGPKDEYDYCYCYYYTITIYYYYIVIIISLWTKENHVHQRTFSGVRAGRNWEKPSQSTKMRRSFDLVW